MKTKEEILNGVKKYLTKTSNHLFTTKAHDFYKVEMIERDDKIYRVYIGIKNANVTIRTEQIGSYDYWQNNLLNLIQSSTFPTYYETKSIPYFKKMREFVKEIMSEVKVDNKANLELAEKMKDKISDLAKI
jgi:predicted double-glycine peptidase